MNVKKRITTPFISVLTTALFLSCSDKGPQPGCYLEEGLEIKETLTNAGGTIRGLDNTFCETGFVIEPDLKVERRPLGSFFPCNLTDEFKVDGARIIFSGYVYEGINDGDQCADFFELTEIRLR